MEKSSTKAAMLKYGVQENAAILNRKGILDIRLSELALLFLI